MVGTDERSTGIPHPAGTPTRTGGMTRMTTVAPPTMMVVAGEGTMTTPAQDTLVVAKSPTVAPPSTTTLLGMIPRPIVGEATSEVGTTRAPLAVAVPIPAMTTTTGDPTGMMVVGAGMSRTPGPPLLVRAARTLLPLPRVVEVVGPCHLARLLPLLVTNAEPQVFMKVLVPFIQPLMLD